MIVKLKIISSSILENSSQSLDFIKKAFKNENYEIESSVWCAYFKYKSDYFGQNSVAICNEVEKDEDFKINLNEFIEIIPGGHSDVLGSDIPLEENEIWKLIWKREDEGFIGREYTNDFVKYNNKNKKIEKMYLKATRISCGFGNADSCG